MCESIYLVIKPNRFFELVILLYSPLKYPLATDSTVVHVTKAKIGFLNDSMIYLFLRNFAPFKSIRDCRNINYNIILIIDEGLQFITICKRLLFEKSIQILYLH